MKIDALRVAAFKRFAEPAAIEDFREGLNVLAGPNEMGKSTLFRALEAAFLVRHKVTGAVLSDMRPMTGGEPLVEADFACDSVRWRIRKQFGRSNAAILTNLDTGRVVSRNAEAEEQLARLIGKPDEMAGPLGLVWVRQQHTLGRPDLDTDADTGREKERGELSALQAAISREVDLVAGGDRLQQVQKLTAKALDVLLTPTRNGPKRNGPLDVARRARDETRDVLERANRAAAQAELRLGEISQLSDQLAVLTAPDAAHARRRELQQREADHLAEVRRRTELDLARANLQSRVLQAQTVRQALEAVHQRRERIIALDGQRQLAASLEAEISTLSSDLNDDGATRPRIEQLGALAMQRDMAGATLSGEAARVDIELESGSAGRVRISGEAVSGSLTRNVREQLEIQIDGVGTIRVSAAGADRMAAARDAQMAASQKIADLLSLVGASSIDDARQMAEARALKVEALDRARAKLSGVAPAGTPAIGLEIARLSDEAQAPAVEAQQLPGLDTAARDAREKVEALQAAVLSEPAFRDAVAALDAARTAEATAADTIRRLATRIDNLKSEQAGADEDGLAGQVDTLAGTLERQDADVKRLEAEGKALLLLAATLDSIEAKARDAFFEPVTRRLQPHLKAVFGAADLGFKDAFAISGLTRSGLHEDFEALSDGTQEQLSVLVRLAFAELLSERGLPVPLVFDDPLVYSDDQRLAAICRELEKAAAQLQIIVMTCRATAFQTISGHRLSVTAWRPDA